MCDTQPVEYLFHGQAFERNIVSNLEIHCGCPGLVCDDLIKAHALPITPDRIA